MRTHTHNGDNEAAAADDDDDVNDEGVTSDFLRWSMMPKYLVMYMLSK